MECLTASRLSQFRRCPRAHWYRYELRLFPVHTSDALTFGSAWHRGLELCAALPEGSTQEHAIAEAALMLPAENPHLRQMFAALLAAYLWYYEQQPLAHHAIEHEFRLPLTNPATGRTSQLWELAGKIDGIVDYAGRLMVLEHKTAGDDISPGADYWTRLRCDPQISQYVLAAQAQGFDTATVLYDVTRKPAHRPSQVPDTDDKGPIVLDADGDRVYKANGEPRATSDKKKGYTLQTTTETPEAYGQRIWDEVTGDPGRYFVRMEIPILQDHIDEFAHELWQQAKAIREAQRAGRWYRSIDRNTCPFCSYRQLCHDGVQIDPEAPPVGYTIHDTPHPELATA